MRFGIAKLAVVLSAAVLTGLAYSSILNGGYAVTVALTLIIVGVFASSGSASKAVFLAMVLYTVPYTIGASQFLPVAFPTTYRQLAGLILKSSYFSTALPVFALLGLSITADYVEGLERWEKVLKGAGGRNLPYGIPLILLAFALALMVTRLGELGGGALPGAFVLPIALLALGLVVSYASIEGGSYRRVLVAVEVPPVNGSVLIETPDEERVLQVSRSAGFEWRAVRLEAELRGRPRRVLFRGEGRERILSPLVESVDGETLFLLYRLGEKVNIQSPPKKFW